MSANIPILLNIHYNAPEGDFMDTLGVDEIDTQSEAINQVYRVEYNGQTFEGETARHFLRNISQQSKL